MMNQPTLTVNESKVFEALEQNALDCSGGDFSLAEEIDVKALGFTKQQFGALLTTLAAKGSIRVSVEYINGGPRSKGTKVTQVTF